MTFKLHASYEFNAKNAYQYCRMVTNMRIMLSLSLPLNVISYKIIPYNKDNKRNQTLINKMKIIIVMIMLSC